MILIHYSHLFFLFFFFNDTATTEIYTLSLHDALPIYACAERQLLESEKLGREIASPPSGEYLTAVDVNLVLGKRSEEHTSELQSQSNLVCRLLLEKKKII